MRKRGRCAGYSRTILSQQALLNNKGLVCKSPAERSRADLVFMVDNMAEVSVIIPLYKTEDCMGRAVDSVINQTFKDIEIILVDDGSPDRCGVIADEYAAMDSRIRVIKKKNGGLSDARNVGMAVCQAPYFTFLDSDDYLEAETIEVMLKESKGKDLDIYCCAAIKTDTDGKSRNVFFKRSSPGVVMEGVQILAECIRDDGNYIEAWGKLYKKEFVEEYKFRFLEGFFHEDVLWTPQMMIHAKRVTFDNHYFYSHCLRPTSITQSGNKARRQYDITVLIMELYKDCKELPQSSLKETIINYALKLFMLNSGSKEFMQSEYKRMVDKSFVKGKTYGLEMRIRVLIYLINPRLYSFCVIMLSKLIYFLRSN